MKEGDRILRPQAAADRLGMHIRTFYREIAAGNIPGGIQITDRARGWRSSTIDQVIMDREAGRRITTEVSAEPTGKRGPGRPRKIAHIGHQPETKGNDDRNEQSEERRPII